MPSLNRRDDGTLVGGLADSKHPVGQKATFELSLILGKGTYPIVIYKPEDALSNELGFE